MIYFDNAATTYPKPEEVYQALEYANRNLAFNAGRGSYQQAKDATQMIEETREELASFVHTERSNVVFTTSATEAMNLIIFGLEWKEGDNVYVSPFEHNSIMRPLEEIKKRYHINIRVLPFDKKTWMVQEQLEDYFTINKPNYIFCSSKSNVTGYKLPVKKIFELGKKYNSMNILDASQSYGVDRKITSANTDFIIFAGHKSLYASFGIAGFVKLTNRKLKSYLLGGTGSDSLNLQMPEEEPIRYEAGSKNIVAIYGLHESIKWLKKKEVDMKEHLLFTYLYEKIKDNNKIIKYVPEDIQKCSGILSINVENYTAEEVGNILNEEYQICVRTGYHCCPLVHDFLDSKKYYGTVRISMNYFNTEEEIDQLVNAINSL